MKKIANEKVVINSLDKDFFENLPEVYLTRKKRFLISN